MSIKFEWVEPIRETVWNLSLPPFFSVRYRSFLGGSAPPFSAVTEELPLTPGSYLKYVNTGSRQLDLTMLVRAPNDIALWNLLTVLPRIFDPIKTTPEGNLVLGKLRVTIPNGITREVLCICSSGFKINEDSLLPNAVEATLTFFAPNPYFRSLNSKNFGGTIIGNSPKWFPIFPLVLGSSANTAELTIQNDGETDAYPTWIVRGTGVNPVLKNMETGKVLDLSANGGVILNAGQSITINTENRTIRRGNVNLIPRMTLESSFWPLVPGSNRVQITMDGIDANSSVSGQFVEGFLGVL
jgi:hypothetical protein